MFLDLASLVEGLPTLLAWARIGSQRKEKGTQADTLLPTAHGTPHPKVQELSGLHVGIRLLLQELAGSGLDFPAQRPRAKFNSSAEERVSAIGQHQRKPWHAIENRQFSLKRFTQACAY